MRRLVFMLLLCCPLTVAGEWVRLGTVGPVHDISELLATAMGRTHQQETISQIKPFTSERYPILSEGITPGRIQSTAQRFSHLKQPLCVVGPDDASRRWIVTHRKRLVETKSVCVLTNIENSTQHHQLSQLLLGIPHYAAPVSDLFASLAIAHYPVLISRKGIEQ